MLYFCFHTSIELNILRKKEHPPFNVRSYLQQEDLHLIDLQQLCSHFGPI